MPTAGNRPDAQPLSVLLEQFGTEWGILGQYMVVLATQLVDTQKKRALDVYTHAAQASDIPVLNLVHGFLVSFAAGQSPQQFLQKHPEARTISVLLEVPADEHVVQRLLAELTANGSPQLPDLLRERALLEYLQQIYVADGSGVGTINRALSSGVRENGEEDHVPTHVLSSEIEQVPDWQSLSGDALLEAWKQWLARKTLLKLTHPDAEQVVPLNWLTPLVKSTNSSPSARISTLAVDEGCRLYGTEDLMVREREKLKGLKPRPKSFVSYSSALKIVTRLAFPSRKKR